MASSNLLMQYQSESLEALKSAAKVSKPFEKVLMDTLKLFMAIPSKVNFLQMGRYGEFSEQTYRNNFENETFDWFAFNEHLIRKTLTGKFLSIAVDPSFLPKSLKRFIKAAVWYPDEEDRTKGQIYFSSSTGPTSYWQTFQRTGFIYWQGRLGPEKINELLLLFNGVVFRWKWTPR